MKIMQFPLAKITIVFILGILFSFYEKPALESALIVITISFIAFSTCFLLSKKDFTQKIYFGITLYLLSFSIGVTTQVVHTDYFQKNNYIHQIQDSEKEHTVEIVLREKLKSSTFSDRYIAIVKNIDNKVSSGRILINFYSCKLNEKLQIGTNLQIKGTVIKHKPVNNPDQFDYGKYLINKSVLAQIYVSAYDIKVSPKIDRNIWYYSNKLRNKIVANLRKTGFRNEELNVLLLP